MPNRPVEQMDNQACKMVAEFFSVYANPVRIQIFCALSQGRKTVSELARHAGVTMQNVSQHLRVMRDKGAVHSEKDGQRVYYSIADPQFLRGVRTIRDALLEQLKTKAVHIAEPVRAPLAAELRGEWDEIDFLRHDYNV